MSIVGLVILALTVVPVGEFRSVELRNGGHVVVRHGAVQKVSIVKDDDQCTQVRVRDGKLIIDRGSDCRHGYRREIEVVTPYLTRAAVSNGGTVEVRGDFPDQASIEAAVEQGGMVDIRSISVDDVEASVYSGGRIVTTAQKSLTASVESGGAITYFGDVEHVKKSVRDGGVVTRGTRDQR